MLHVPHCVPRSEPTPQFRAIAHGEARLLMDAPREPVNILIVDDSPIYRKLVEHSLPGADYTFLVAKNGSEALKLFHDHRPSLVITDWSMPDFSGPELCKKIREGSQQHFAYLILLTSNDRKEQIIEGLSAGADDYLTKPFHPGELVARVEVGRRMLDLHRQIEAKNKQLEEMALTDALTSLPNRRAVDLWASRQISAASRHGFPLWVTMCDLDHFKKINDTFGHDAGDAVIKAFAEVLRVNTRQSNICARLGGEEFLMILTHIDKAQVTIAIERVRERFAALKFDFEGKSASATASFGVAGYTGGAAPDLNSLLVRADKALYSAKNRGRNRVEFEAQ